MAHPTTKRRHEAVPPREDTIMTLEFYLDYRSPYSYLAGTQVRNWEIPIGYSPVDIVAVMKMVNNQPSPLCPPKARYAEMDARRWAKLYDVPFSPNAALLKAMQTGTLDGSLLSRVALASQKIGVFERVNDALLGAVWAGTDDLVTERGRAAFLETHAIVASDLWRVASSSEIVALLRLKDQEAADRGVFGVPTFFLENEMFFGNDRLDFIKTRLK
jgi:2-hydroxychromene-2-carboxylate isomerase